MMVAETWWMWGEAMLGSGGKPELSSGRANLNDEQRASLETLAARMRRIVVGEFPELYLRVNEVPTFDRRQGIKKGGVAERKAGMPSQLNSAKFCFGGRRPVAEVLLPRNVWPGIARRVPGQLARIPNLSLRLPVGVTPSALRLG
jgi:hypothetical protein